MSNSITWKIGGEAGFGIATTGLMFSKLAARSGFQIFSYFEYPSLIRGGHNVQEVRYSPDKIYSQEKGVDFLVALNRETLDLHKDELKKGAGILFDKEKINVSESEFAGEEIKLLPIPFAQIIKEGGLSSVMQNNIALGASACLLAFKKEMLFSVIADTFKKKGTDVVALNQKAAEEGYKFVVSNLLNKFKRELRSVTPQKRLVISGNEAVGLGAITAGCGFYVAYPMTPTSSLLHFLAEKAGEVGMVVKHAEDEISVINMAIGASFAGVRSMVGTAGGGFSLMVEGLGLAGITETPIVIMVGQRPGPATGMPTWTGQGDLKFLIHASQDEFPRIILAPGDATEAFYLTAEAFNLADIYQTPVFIISDKYLGESHQSVNLYDTSLITQDRGKTIKEAQANLANYKRYQDTPDGISPRVVAGVKGTQFVANSYEHGEDSFSTEEADERIKQVNKRNRKLETYKNNMPAPKIYGEEVSDITLIGWGSTKRPVLQALSDINFTYQGKSVNFLHLTHVFPLNNKAISNILKKAKKKIMIEGNSEGQMAFLLREQTGIVMDDLLLKYDGRPFYPEEIINKLSLI